MATPPGKRARPESSPEDPTDGHTSSAEQQHMDESLLYGSESQEAGADAQLKSAAADPPQLADLMGLHSLLVRWIVSSKVPRSLLREGSFPSSCSLLHPSLRAALRGRSWP